MVCQTFRLTICCLIQTRNFKLTYFKTLSFSGRVHCTRYQISAGANAPAAPVLDLPLIGIVLNVRY